MMLMNMVMKMSNVWSARPGHSLPAEPCESFVCGPPTHKLRTKIPDQPPNFYQTNLPTFTRVIIILYKHYLYCL